MRAKVAGKRTVGRRLSIRAKVGLASLLLLAIPWIGYRYVVEMENHLRDGLEETVAGAAAAVAGALHDRPDILPIEGLGASPGAADIDVYSLEHPIEIDGYDREWQDYLGYERELAALAASGPMLGSASATATLVAAKHGRHLYARIAVQDDVLAFGNPEIPGRAASDRVRLRAIDARGRDRYFVLTSLSPGWVGAYEILAVSPSDGAPGELRRPEARIRAAWQRRPGGYVMEIKAPLGLVSPSLAVDVVDVDRHPRGYGPLILSSAAGTHDGAPGALRLPSAAIEGVLRGLGRTAGRRIRVVDARGRVLARGGDLESAAPPDLLSSVLGLALSPPRLGDEQAPATPPETLSDPVVAEALGGQAARRWRRHGEHGLFVLTAAEPVRVGEAVAGAVVVEQSTSGIVAARRETLAGLVQETLAVFALVTLVLALVAARLAGRLGRLRDEADAAIDGHGRVVAAMSPERAGDEIGDLGRAFAAMLERLRQHNQYLENLARRLSHELRTPIAVTRSSLDALEADAGGDREVYLARAREGLHRLDRILTRMSEASRLEQALADTDREPFDVAALVAASASAYSQVWPDTRFEYEGPATGVEIVGSADLMAQALDKLVANARDFHTAGTPVRLELETSPGRAALSVVNRGASLPSGAELFDPMVSVREPGTASEPHLGLGLYIVRLIAAFHGGSVEARDDSGGVRVTLALPRGEAPAPRQP